MMMETALSIHIQEIIYNSHTIFMVSWWRRYAYFNNELIIISNVVLTNATYGSSGFFGSILGSKCIGKDISTGRRSNLCSKATPIHGPVNTFELKFSYSRSLFCWSPQAVSKLLINRLSQKTSYAYVRLNGIRIYDRPPKPTGCRFSE